MAKTTSPSKKTEKYCPMCEKTLPVEMFGLNAGQSDGLRGYCFPCSRIRCAKDYADPSGEKQKKHRAIMKRIESDNPKSKSAHKAVRLALKDGTLVRPMKCSVCEKIPETRALSTGLIAHHDDYNNKLDVRWLCRSCHSAWHKENEPLC